MFGITVSDAAQHFKITEENLKRMADSTPKCNPCNHAASFSGSAKKTSCGVLKLSVFRGR